MHRTGRLRLWEYGEVVAMPDVEKVIKALECCTAELGTNQHKDDFCQVCPYRDKNPDMWYCFRKQDLMRDALALLKAHEPRVMTLKELDALGDKAIVWLECLYTVDGMKTITVQPAIYQPENSGPEEDGYYCVVSSWSHSGFYHKDNYGCDWRCWTSCPDEKRRAEMPWQQ